MKLFLKILAGLIILSGGVWFLQGIGVLPGSSMTGQIQWAYYGVLAVLIGGIVLFVINRKRN